MLYEVPEPYDAPDCVQYMPEGGHDHCTCNNGIDEEIMDCAVMDEDLSNPT